MRLELQIFLAAWLIASAGTEFAIESSLDTVTTKIREIEDNDRSARYNTSSHFGMRQSHPPNFGERHRLCDPYTDIFGDRHRLFGPQNQLCTPHKDLCDLHTAVHAS